MGKQTNLRICREMQIDNMKSMIPHWTLGIANGNDKIFAQFGPKVYPVSMVQWFTHPCKTGRCDASEVAICKQTGSTWNCTCDSIENNSIPVSQGLKIWIIFAILRVSRNKLDLPNQVGKQQKLNASTNRPFRSKSVNCKSQPIQWKDCGKEEKSCYVQCVH